MERKYIYFRTGEGFLALVVGLLLIAPFTLWLLIWLPHSMWIHIWVILLSVIVVVCIAFKVDELSLRKKNQSTQRKRETVPLVSGLMP